jgi:predicted dehydrogenase
VLRIAVIGYGYWGPNLVRNFLKVDDCEVVAISDANRKRLEHARRLHPHLETASSGIDLVKRPDIDAIVIVTPVSTHYELAVAAVRAGKHVLVTKPLTRTAAQAEELIALAERQKRVLLVDHTFIYSGAVRKIRELVDNGELGEIYYYDSIRVNLGLFQPDVNVLWDLAPHDFSIMSYMVAKEPISVSAIGAQSVNYTTNALESVAYASIRFDDRTIAHVHVNWLSPVKIRRTLIGGSRKMVVYDHLDPDNQIKVYDKGVEICTREEQYQALVQYRLGDMYAPKIDQTEALEMECRHFVECCLERAEPITDGRSGLQVVRLLEAAQQSMHAGGTSVMLQPFKPSINNTVSHPVPKVDFTKHAPPLRHVGGIRRSEV